MRKQVFGRQLQRDTNERKALFKSLMESLVLEESIKTTEAKAKSVKGHVEKMVTKARLGGVKAERALQQYFKPAVMKKLVNEIAPRFQNRPGGYTRIIKLGNRFSDNAPMVVLEWVVKEETSNKKQETNKKDVVASEAKQSGSEEKLEATTPVDSAKQNTKKNKTSAKTSKSKKSSSGGK